MRLREIQNRLRKGIPLIRIKPEPFNAQSGETAYRIRDKSQLFDGLTEIMHIPALKEHALSLMGSSLFSEPGDPIVLRGASFNEAKTSLDRLEARAVDLLAVLDAALPPQEPLSLAFKLPRDVTTIAELEATIGRLERIFEQPIRRAFSEPVKFHSFDTGTAWIEFLFVTKATIGFAIGMFKAAQHLRKFEIDNEHRNNLVQQSAQRGIIDSKNREAIEAANETLVKAYAQRLAADLVERRTPSKEDQELINATLVSIREFSEMLAQGAEVRLSLDAPKDVQESFPREPGALPTPPPLLEPGDEPKAGGEGDASGAEADAGDPHKPPPGEGPLGQ